jgi:hypothetical protein
MHDWPADIDDGLGAGADGVHAVAAGVGGGPPGDPGQRDQAGGGRAQTEQVDLAHEVRHLRVLLTGLVDDRHGVGHLRVEAVWNECRGVATGA